MYWLPRSLWWIGAFVCAGSRVQQCMLEGEQEGSRVVCSETETAQPDDAPRVCVGDERGVTQPRQDPGVGNKRPRAGWGVERRTGFHHVWASIRRICRTCGDWCAAAAYAHSRPVARMRRTGLVPPDLPALWTIAWWILLHLVDTVVVRMDPPESPR